MSYAESQTFQALNGLNVRRRVILSGTPIQVSPSLPRSKIPAYGLKKNDLSEYFSLLNFANPNFLGSKNDFRKNFENAIIRGRDADATDAAKAESEKRLKELGGLVSKFIIRRTNDLLSKYRELAPSISVIQHSLTSYDSARQVRTSRILYSLPIPARLVSTLHQVP